MVFLQIEPACTHPEVKWFYWIIFLILGALLSCLCSVSELIKEPVSNPDADPKSKYSFARSQVAWWFLIIFSGFVIVYFCIGTVPVPNETVLWLLGISGGTMVSSGFVNYVNTERGYVRRMALSRKKTWIWDFLREIMSDENVLSIYRFQAVIFNFLYGIIFIGELLKSVCTNSPEFPAFSTEIRTLLVIS